MIVDACLMDRMEEVLVTTDGSESSRNAVHEAIQLAKECSSKLIVVSVVVTNLAYEDFVP